MTRGLPRLEWRAYALAVLLVGAPPSALASFTGLDETIGYDELVEGPRATQLRWHYDGETRWRIHRHELLRSSGARGFGLGPDQTAEAAGGRAMSWSWDAWSRPTSVTLPVGAGRGGGTFTGFARDFDSLDRLVDVSGAGANGLSLTPIGARWTWGGGDRLYAMDTKGALGTASRWGWHDGGGPQLPNAPVGEASRWKLATLEWGAASGGSSPTASPTVSWGRFGYGWRGHEGEAADGAKLGRQVLGTTSGIDVAASLGWSWGYDAGVRLAGAESGRGSVAGGASPDGEAWRYGYGEGDELERIVREGAGAIAELETGIYGRILARDGVAFAHDGAGRRTLDDRFRYRWNWRGELTEVEVLESWRMARSRRGPGI